MPRAFVIYSSRYEAWVEILVRNLEQCFRHVDSGEKLALETVELTSTGSWISELHESIDNVDHLILVATPETLAPWAVGDIGAFVAQRADWSREHFHLLHLAESQLSPLVKQVHYLDFRDQSEASYRDSLRILADSLLDRTAGKPLQSSRIEIPMALVSTLQATAAREARKRDQMAAMQALLRRVKSVEGTAFERFALRAYEGAPPSDLTERPAKELLAAARSLWELGETRQVGEARVRIDDPEPQVRGWSPKSSVVEVVTDEMPFIFDSITAGLKTQSFAVHRVLETTVVVRRGTEGERLEARDEVPESGELASEWSHEHYLQLEIEYLHAAQRAWLRRDVFGILADVRAAVEDWSKMREHCRRLVEDTRREPPSLPAEEIAEATEFLEWLADDHFTLPAHLRLAHPVKRVRP